MSMFCSLPIPSRRSDVLMPHGRLSEDQLMNSAMEMYLYSLSIHDKLPEKLHEAMLLWSFHPEQKNYVKDYLIWVETCEKRKIQKIKFDKRLARINFFEKLNYIVVAIFLLFLFFAK